MMIDDASSTLSLSTPAGEVGMQVGMAVGLAQYNNSRLRRSARNTKHGSRHGDQHLLSSRRSGYHRTGKVHIQLQVHERCHARNSTTPVPTPNRKMARTKPFVSGSGSITWGVPD